jgi:nucleotide-binding universal stress UspA family protein
VLFPDAARCIGVDPVDMALPARRIVVGYDGSDAARRALDAAADLTGYGSTLSVVTVQTEDVEQWISSDARARLLERHVAARYHVTAGEPAEELVEKAAELGADLLVVGRRSRSPLRALLGSVSSRVVRRAGCDVLVVR